MDVHIYLIIILSFILLNLLFLGFAVNCLFDVITGETAERRKFYRNNFRYILNNNNRED